MSDSCFIYFLWAPHPHRCAVIYWPSLNFCTPTTLPPSFHFSYSVIQSINLCCPLPLSLVFAQLALPSFQSSCTEGLLRNFPVSAQWYLPCLYLFLCALYLLCKRPISWGIASNYLSCPDQFSSLSKSLQLCPVPTLPYLESLEISRRRVLTLLLLLVSPWSSLPTPCLERPEAVGKAEISPAQLDTARLSWAEAMAWLTSMLPGALLLRLGARGDSWKAGGSHMFRGCALT